MSQSVEDVHVAFGVSIAATLREALPKLGITARVVGLPDALNVGPIDPPDPHVRQAWGKAVLRADPMLGDGLVDDPTEVEKAWAEATAPGLHPVLWVCLNSPAEHACLLAFSAHTRDRPFDLVDASDLDFTTVGGIERPRSLGLMRVQDIVRSNVHGRRRRPVPSEERRAASRAWAVLRRENAPFRVVRDGRLVSAPLTHYDALLVDQVSHDWEISARVIGRAMSTFERGLGGEATSDMVLFGRLLSLGEDGALAIAGSGPGMRDYRVRRAPSDPARPSPASNHA